MGGYKTQFDMQIIYLISQDQVSPDVGTQMETEQHGEVVEKHHKAEDETETEKDRQTEID